MSKKNICVAVVADYKFLIKYFYKFDRNLRRNGRFKNQLVVITNFNFLTYLYQLLIIFKFPKTKFLRFRNIKFSGETNNELNNLETGTQPNRHINKKFQWHKINLFDKKLKKWQFVFYMDINMTIHHDINPIIKEVPNGKLFAREDGYPNFERILASQFDTTKKQYQELKNNYDLNYKKYFQSGILFYDTKIISNETKNELITLVEKYPITKTNEQAIMNLYFIFDKDVYKELPYKSNEILNYYYWLLTDQKIRITKQTRTQYK